MAGRALAATVCGLVIATGFLGPGMVARADGSGAAGLTLLLSQGFHPTRESGDFIRVEGGAWRVQDRTMSLVRPAAVRGRQLESNILVLRPRVGMSWRLEAALAYGAGTKGEGGFSLIFDLHSRREYWAVVFEPGPLARGAVFQVDPRGKERVAAFSAPRPKLAAGHFIDVTLTASSGRLELREDGKLLAVFRAPKGPAEPARVGFGSAGGRVLVRSVLLYGPSHRPAVSRPTRSSGSPSPAAVASGHDPGTPVAASGGSSPHPSPEPLPPTPRPAPLPTASPGGPSPTAPAPSPPPGSSGSLATFFGPDFDPSAAFCAFSHQMISISAGVLTVTYPAGSTAPSMGPPYGGAQICEPATAGPQTSATLTYELRFPVGFQFVKGGKLPGIYGGQEPFSGGAHNPDGWSMRLMWRPGGAGEIYAYIAGVSGYGLNLGLGDFTWPADGRWHAVSLQVTLNGPGEANGEAVLELDGRVVIDATGLDITQTATPISGLFFSTFYGGHDSSWAPTQPMELSFSQFTMN